MKKKFTFLIAALMLLFAIPMMGRGQTTVTQTNFTNYSGNLDGNTQVTFQGYKGGGTSTPYASGGTIRLYQNASGETGGYIVIGVPENYNITSATIQSSMATTTGYLLTNSDPGNTTPAKNTFDVNDYSLSANTDYTVSNISSRFITFACFGTTSSTRLYVSKISITYESSGGTTYTVTYHANVTGISDITATYSAGATVTIATNTFTNPGYDFTEWNTEEDGSGESYAPGAEIEDIADDYDFYAQWEESNELTLTFPLDSNPGGWPTANSTTLTLYTYTLNNVVYTFALKNVKCNSGYLMCTSVAVVGLPAIEGYKLTKVIASNSSGCSTATQVGISSSDSQANYIAGGNYQTWSTQGSQYTYNLTSTAANTMYYMYVTNKNAQVTSLALTYEAVSAETPSITANDVNIAYNATSGNIAYTINDGVQGGVLTASVNGTPTIADFQLGNETNSPISFTCSANDGVVALTATVTLTYTYNTNQTVTKNVTVTQAVDATLGTASNPYTVEQARAVIDANSTASNVYATGIVSQIVSSNMTDGWITYNISTDGTTSADQLQAYKGKSFNGDSFTSVNDIQVGATVVIYGNLKKFSSTYEFDQNNQLYQYAGPAVAAPIFDPAGGTFDETQTVTITCETDNADIYYTNDGTEPDANSTLYTEPLTISSTTTLKAIAYYGGVSSTVSTATYTIVAPANISSITEVGTAYTVKGTVVAINSRGFVMGDGTGYVYYYNNAAVSQSVGDKVKVAGTTGSYGHIIQFTNTATITTATTSNYDGTPAATVITEVPDYTTDYHLSTYFEFEGALTKSSNNYFITLGSSEIQISYPTTEQGTALTALVGKNVHVTGYFTGINSNSKFTVMLESVEEVIVPTITVSPATASHTATDDQGTLDITFENLTVSDPENIDVELCDEDGEAATYDWFDAEIIYDEEYQVSYIMFENEGETARTAYLRVFALDDDDELVYSNIVTINQAAPVIDYAYLPFTWDNATTPTGVTLTRVGTYSSSPYLKMNSSNGEGTVVLKINADPGVIEFDVKANPSSGDYSTGTFSVMTSSDGTNYTTLASYTQIGKTKQTLSFTDISADTRYIKWSYVKESSDGNVALGKIVVTKAMDIDENTTWTAGSFTPADNHTYIVENGATLTLSGDFSSVITDASQIIIKDGGQLITSNSVKATVEKSVHASEAKTANHWCVISSPVNNVAIASFVPAEPTDEKWNVYRYDETEVQWEEYRDSNNQFSTLDNGRGYLYRSTAADINFVGDVNVEDAEYQLTYTPAVGDYAGFHLIGNPFTHNIYKGENGAIDDSDNLEDGFYTLSSACAWVAGTDNTDAIAPTQAILVQAKSTADGETLEITNTTAGYVAPTGDKSGNNQIMFAVKNAEYSDVAYVLFKEGHGLNKVEHRNADIPMLYVINNGEEFAIADMPDNTSVINLGFEAKTMGQYTISLKAEGQYSYMHLIDKLTGEDTDMLVEDSYTFVGSQSDRNDRFVLRLNYNAAGIDSESDIFAYQNGNDIIVRGEGTLQVFDITGRMVMSTRIDGVETINGIESGVYIFKMEGKTQKIVVR